MNYTTFRRASDGHGLPIVLKERLKQGPRNRRARSDLVLQIIDVFLYHIDDLLALSKVLLHRLLFPRFLQRSADIR